jgi:hypothetical protein
VDPVSRKLLGTIAMIVALVIVTVGGAGVAFAYWTASGAGSGFSVTGTTTALTISQGIPTANLLPGGHTDVVLTMTNPNTAQVKISSLVLDTTQGTGGFASSISGCDVSTLTFTTQTNGGAGWSVPGKVGTTNGTLAVTLPNALSMSTTAANACQGATFTVYLLGA